MAELIRCDNCQIEIDRDFRYLEVRMHGYARLETDAEERQFCSERCVGKFYKSEDDLTLKEQLTRRAKRLKQ